jgi:hypothetical protein
VPVAARVTSATSSVMVLVKMMRPNGSIRRQSALDRLLLVLSKVTRSPAVALIA